MERYEFDAVKELTKPAFKDGGFTPQLEQQIWQVVKNKKNVSMSAGFKKYLSTISMVGVTSLLLMFFAQSLSVENLITKSLPGQLSGMLQHGTKQIDATGDFGIDSPLQLDVPGPVHHVVIESDGKRNETWKNVETGNERSVVTIGRDTTIVYIVNNEYQYSMTYDLKGNLIDAQKQKLKPEFVNKVSPFQAQKVVIDPRYNTGFESVESSYNNIPVKIWSSNYEKNPWKDYVDKKYDLILKREQNENGVTKIYTFKYSYLQSDGDLFDIPSNITFRGVQGQSNMQQ